MQFTSCRGKEKKRKATGGEGVRLCVSGARQSVTHRHCYLPLARGGREEVLLTAGLPADTEKPVNVEAKAKKSNLLSIPSHTR